MVGEDGLAPADPVVLDELDRRLLALLVKDGRRSVNDLALHAGVSRSGAYQRLGRLTRLGVIEGFAARVNRRRLGLAISALVLIGVEQRAWRQVRPQLLAVPGAEWLGVAAGEFDFVLLVRVVDVDTLRDVVLERLQAIDGVRTSETVLLLEDHAVGEVLG